MDANGAEALRRFLEQRHGGDVPATPPARIEGTGLAHLEGWFRVLDERPEDGAIEPAEDAA
jgi:hypothetical protein